MNSTKNKSTENEGRPLKKEAYVKPACEIIKLELEQPILSGSAPDFGNGGKWGGR